MLNQIDKNIIPFTIGDDNSNTFIGYFTGDIGFGKHSATAEAGFGSLYIRRKIFPLADFPDDLRSGIGRRTVINTVDVT